MNNENIVDTSVLNRKADAYDKIYAIVDELDKQKDIDLDMLVNGLSDIRDCLDV